MKLLLADDHALFREALIIFIQAKQPKWSVETASNISEAVSLIDKNKFDLALLDLRMPGMGNMNGIKMIKDQYPDLSIAILSGVAAEEDVRKAIKMGVKAYFPKTLSGNALLRLLILLCILTILLFRQMRRE